MKIGAENRKQVIAMVVLLAIAIPLAIYEFPSIIGTSSAAPPATVSTPTTTPSRPSRKLQGPGQEARIDPRFRKDIFEASQNIKYEGGSRNIFVMEAPKIEAMSEPVRKPGPTPSPTPTPIPTPTPYPPIQLTYYGFATSPPGEPKRVFIAQGDHVFVVKQGDFIARQYRVVQIAPTSVMIEDVLHNYRQSIPLTAR